MVGAWRETVFQEAGETRGTSSRIFWIPAFAGMTNSRQAEGNVPEGIQLPIVTCNTVSYQENPAFQEAVLDSSPSPICHFSRKPQRDALKLRIRKEPMLFVTPGCHASLSLLVVAPPCHFDRRAEKRENLMRDPARQHGAGYPAYGSRFERHGEMM